MANKKICTDISSGNVVRVIVTCSDRKTIPPQPKLRAAKLNGETTERRCREWIARLKGTPPDSTAASLYAGDAWTVIRSIDPPQGWTVELWVLSAGYGLVRGCAELASYSAAFSTGKEDTVTSSHTTKQATTTWWDTLCRWEGPEPGQPRSIAQLAAEDPTSPLVVAGSRAYVTAIQDDLRRAPNDGAPIFLMTAGSIAIEGVHQIPTDARLSTTLAGSRMSLNARAMKHLVEGANRHSFQRQRVDAEFEALLAQGRVETYNRIALTDAEVTDFVRQQLIEAQGRGDGFPTKTALLRRLRDSGHACEQKRFGLLYGEVQTSLATGRSVVS